MIVWKFRRVSWNKKRESLGEFVWFYVVKIFVLSGIQGAEPLAGVKMPGQLGKFLFLLNCFIKNSFENKFSDLTYNFYGRKFCEFLTLFASFWLFLRVLTFASFSCEFLIHASFSCEFLHASFSCEFSMRIFLASFIAMRVKNSQNHCSYVRKFSSLKRCFRHVKFMGMLPNDAVVS